MSSRISCEAVNAPAQARVACKSTQADRSGVAHELAHLVLQNQNRRAGSAMPSTPVEDADSAADPRRAGRGGRAGRASSPANARLGLARPTEKAFREILDGDAHQIRTWARALTRRPGANPVRFCPPMAQAADVDLPAAPITLGIRQGKPLLTHRRWCKVPAQITL
jgi:hypothetical protein